MYAVVFIDTVGCMIIVVFMEFLEDVTTTRFLAVVLHLVVVTSINNGVL